VPIKKIKQTEFEQLDEVIKSFEKILPSIRHTLPYKFTIDHKLLSLNLSNIKFGRKKDYVKTVSSYLSKCKEIKELRLDNCGLIKGRNFNKILKSIRECYKLNTLSMVHRYDEKLDIFMGNLERNISVTSFKFLEEECHKEYEDELKEVQRQIDKNIEINRAYPEQNFVNRTMVSIKHAKVIEYLNTLGHYVHV
jgi:hypothetical protein